MSGPKGIGIGGGIALACACPLVLVGGAVLGVAFLADKATKLALAAVHMAQYRRLCEQLEGLKIQLQILGIKKETTWITPDKLMDSEGIDVKKKQIEKLVAKFKDEIREVIITVQARHRRLCERSAIIASERQRFDSFAASTVTMGWPEKDRSEIAALVADALQKGPAIYVTPLALDGKGIQNMDAVEKRCEETILLFQKTRNAMEKAANAAHIQQIINRLSNDQKPSISLADFMKTQISKVQEGEDKILNRLDSMLADVALLKNTASWESLMNRVVGIQKENDKSIRRMKYESLVLECDKQLRVLREYEYWQTEIETLIDSTAPLKGDTNVAAVLAELETLLRAGRVIELDDVRGRLELATMRAKENNGRDYRRRAVIDSLSSMGYEIREGQMETALVSAGKVYFQKPNERDYAVEVVTNNDFSNVQTTVIRFADSQETTQKQKLRDKETEESWCIEHARLRSDLTDRGLDSQFRFRIPAGEKPVRVVLNSDREKNRKDAGAAPVKKRQMQTE